MRSIVAGVFVCFLTAAGATAQPAVLVKSKPIHGTIPDFTADMPSSLRKWIPLETERQFQAPTSLYELELKMLKANEPGLQTYARRQKLSSDEVEILVMHQVITGAATKMDKAVHSRRRALEKAGAPLAQDAELRLLAARKAGLLALIKALGPRMTPNTRLLTSTK